VCGMKISSRDSKLFLSYAFWAGLWAVLPLFNQFDVGINFSVVWLLIPLIFLLDAQKLNIGAGRLFIVFLLFFLGKFLLVQNYDSVIRYLTYIVFISCGLSLSRHRLDQFFNGMEVGLYVNFCFSVLQMIGLLSGVWSGELQPELWNAALWHANPPGGAFDFYPRVSGFANEPAYLSILLSVVVAYRLFVLQKKTLTGWYGVYVFVFFVFLINSRTAYIGYFWIVLCAWLVVRQNYGERFSLYVFILSFVLIPVGIFQKLEFPIDYDQFLIDDISIFTRTVPMLWIFDGNNLNFSDYIFGVYNYRTYVLGIDMPINSYGVFELQGGFLDSKSLGGALFYDFGLVGMFMYIYGVYFLLKNNIRALFFFSTLNIVFFNVYAFSWPLFWFCIISCVAIIRYPNSELVSISNRDPSRT